MLPEELIRMAREIFGSEMVLLKECKFGGMIRTMKVARLAEAAGLKIAPHISGEGLGVIIQLPVVQIIRTIKMIIYLATGILKKMFVIFKRIEN